MKALDILEYKLRDYISDEVHKNCEYYIYSNLIDIVDEAIDELEAMAQPKTCDSCEYVGYFSPHDSLECGNKDCNFYGCDVDYTDGCNKHKQKQPTKDKQ